MFRKSLCLFIFLIPQIIFGEYGYPGENDITKTGVVVGARPFFCIPVSEDIKDLPKAAGSDIHFGWRMSKNLSAHMSYFLAIFADTDTTVENDQLSWGGLVWDIKYYIPIVNAFEAYIVGEGGKYALADEEIRFSGWGFAFGCGFNWWLNKNISIGPEVLVHILSYTRMAPRWWYYDDYKLPIRGNTVGIGLSINYKI